MNQIIAGAEPFCFHGSNIGILLVHGFTGVPREMRLLGEYLHRQYNYTVLGVRLSGHATHPEDMIRSTYGDWLASVEDGFAMLSGMVDSVYIMGLSMGGVLSLTSASYLPVKGVVAMSTPFKLPDDPRLRHIEWISKIVSYMPKSTEEPDAGWFDKQAFKQHISYPQNPVHAIGELNKLLTVMRTSLPLIKVPVLLIHSQDDRYVVKDNMPLIYNALTISDKQMLTIHGSGHVITRDAKREEVFDAAARFLDRICA